MVHRVGRGSRKQCPRDLAPALELPGGLNGCGTCLVWDVGHSPILIRLVSLNHPMEHVIHMPLLCFPLIARDFTCVCPLSTFPHIVANSVTDWCSSLHRAEANTAEQAIRTDRRVRAMHQHGSPGSFLGHSGKVWGSFGALTCQPC